MLFLALCVTSSALILLRSALGLQHGKILDYSRALIPAERMRSALQTYVASDRGYLLTGNDKFLDRLQTANELFEESLYQISMRVKSERGKGLVAKVHDAKRMHQRSVHLMISKRKELGISPSVRQFFEREVFPKRLALQEAVDALVEYKENELFRVESLARSESDSAVLKISAISIVAILLLIVLCVIVTINLTRLYKNAERLQEKYRKTADDLERSNSELEHFASIASHDMRSPLNTISSFGTLLEEKLIHVPDEDAHRYLSFMTKGAEKLRRMVDDLLDYSRVSGEHAKSEVVELSSIMRDTTALLGDEIRSLEARVSCSPLPAVYGNPSQLMHVFQNIISNALKYRKETEHPSIRIFARGKGAHWLIHIEDDGIGIAKDQIEEVFKPFKRLHSYHERPGTGLGLPICRRIVERHGGKYG
ncbi:MAG: ATP-binding protein [Bdellovibrionota bacterium]